MSSFKLTGTLGATLVAAGLAAFGGTAQADLVPTVAHTVVDTDALASVGNSEAALTDADVAFQWDNAATTARLTANIHVVGGNNARYRVRVESYDRQGNLLDTAYDAANGTGVHSDVKDIPVDMTTQSAPYITKVLVAVEKQGTTNKWNTKGATQTTYLNTHDDSALVSGEGIDLGAGPYISSGVPGKGGPLLGATVTWKIGDDGQATSSFDGSLFFDDFSRCGRVVLRSISTLGLQVDEVKGPEYCPADNGFYAEPETLVGDPTGAPTLEVAMQSKTGGRWQDVDTQRVSIAE